ncbi:MAG: hypothetical protein ACI9LG_000711, partial [Moritella dasanensis]
KIVIDSPYYVWAFLILINLSLDILWATFNTLAITHCSK